MCILLSALCCCCTKNSVVLSQDNPNTPKTLGLTETKNKVIEQKVDSILSTLTLKEKIEQLMGTAGKFKLNRGEAITGLNIDGATTLPQQIGISCSWNPELVKNNTRGTSHLMHSLNVRLALSPMLDITRNATWGRMEEGFGEDAYLTSRMGLAFVEGMQNKDITEGVAATVKHFAGYGEKNDDDRVFVEEILMPHEVAIKIGAAQSIMPGYHAYKGIPATISDYLLNTVARGAWKFDGVVVSDYFAVKQVWSAYKQAENLRGAGSASLRNGVDLELPSGDAYKRFEEALKLNEITMEDIDRSCRRILRLKGRLGLLNPNNISKIKVALDPPSRRKDAYNSACQSIVLLKNDGTLPIKENVKKIALVGPNADAFESLLGDYTKQSLSLYWGKEPIQGNNPKLITLFEALTNKLDKDVKLMYERGCEWKEPTPIKKKDGKAFVGDEREKYVVEIASKDFGTPNPEKAFSYAKESDVIIAAMGENRYLCGESRNRYDIRLAGKQEEFVKSLIATGKPVVLIIFGGRPHALSEVVDGCSSIIQAWYPGEEGGNAVADILLGKVNPSAKMTVTVPRTSEQCPIYYRKGYDKNDMPLYPFGHGISYTTYEYKDLEIAKDFSINDKTLAISCNITNTGQCGGCEIVQLYIEPKIDGEIKKLQGFSRVELKVGETKRITFKVSPQQLARLNKEMKWEIHPGDYNIQVAASSTDIRLQKKVIIKGETQKLEGRTIFFSETIIEK